MSRTSKPQRIHGALIYARYSTENQSDKSIEEQIADCRNWCEENGLIVLGIYADYAVSGMKASRPQFDAMLEKLAMGQGDAIVCFDQSRLARDFLNWFALRQQLESMGVRIVSITQQYVGGDIRDNTVLIQETFLALHNQMHVEDTRRKTKAALRYRAQQGFHTGGKPPLGYDLKEKRLIVNQQEAAIVRKIFVEYAAGRSYGELIKLLNAEGHRTKAGKQFGANSLHDLLQNRRYIGEFAFGRKAYDRQGKRSRLAPSGEIVTVEHPELAIVPKEIFEKVQQRMKNNQRIGAGRPTTARNYPLRGKVFCGECGSSMWVQAVTSKGHRYEYYTCTEKKRSHNCELKKIRVDELEGKVLAYVRSILGSADVTAELRQIIRRQADEITSGGVEKAQRLAAELSSVEGKLERVVDAIAELGNSAALTAKLKALEAQQQELRFQLQTLRNAAEAANLPSDRLNALVEHIANTYSEEAVFSIVNRVEVSNSEIKVYTAFDPTDPHKDSIKDLDHTEITPSTPSAPPESPEPFINNLGTSSGVPRIFINPIGLLIAVKR